MLGEKRIIKSNSGPAHILKSVDTSKSLSHYGTLTFSGRYEWGSGERPYQRLRDWKSYVASLRRQGLTDEEIAKGCGMTVQEFKDSMVSTSKQRSMTTIRNAQETVENVAHAWELKNKGYSNVAIAKAMGVSEGTVRNYLKPGADARAKETLAISQAFKDAVAERGIIDCGGGLETHLGVSKTKMDASLELLKEEGYNIYFTKVKQAGTGKDTTIRALCPPGMTYQEFKELYSKDPSVVKLMGYYADEGEIKSIEKPVSISRDRIYIRWGDEAGPDGTTGSERDGTIQIRPGVEDLDLLGTRYAQVRIAVDDKMYMKGMAVYADDIPDGYDVVYNVNRPKGSPDLTEGAREGVFKKMYKKGEDDPFGASTSLKEIDEETGDIIYQKSYVGSDGKQHLSALNIVNDQGSWDDWSPSIASQMLSKQSPDLAKQQLGIVSQSKQDEFDEIMALTNPTVKAKLLDEFASGCDSAAVHLKAAALPRQRSQVLIPIPSLEDDEIYAPNFRDGETVVLIRYPHAGTFEIPELKVNNKNPEGISVIGKSSTGGRALDAVGINAHVAEQLSGADFDGDSVLVIPNNDGKIKVSAALKELKNFDPKVSYKLPEGSPELTRDPAKRESEKQREMGVISNLITDMTIGSDGGASQAEIARAVKHSMVVIDCVKHNLDWKASYKENNIQELKDKYQPKEDPTKPGGGASTLISRAKSEARINEEKQVYSTKQMSAEQEAEYNKLLKTNPQAAAKVTGLTADEKARYDAGEVITRQTGRTKMVKKDGEWVDSGKPVQQKTTKMAATKDARTLSSGTVIEEVYAEHANKLKSLANQARAALRTTPKLEQSPSAKETYAEEVKSLTESLRKAEMNRPVERQAQLIASASLKAKVASNPELKEDKDAYKKAENKALTTARTMIGAKKENIVISDKEWDAIQAGAISDSMLKRILNNTDMDAVKKRATPRASTGLSESQIARIKGMASNGLTMAEIADAIGVSTSSVNTALNG